MARPKLFLDTSVLLAGLASTTGASAEILRLAEVKIVEIVLCETIIVEAQRNISRKIPELLPLFYVALDELKPKIKKDETKLNKILRPHFPKDSDQIIIQTAQKTKPDFVLTLDKKHLLKPIISKLTGLNITTPAEFMVWLRNGKN